MNPKSKKFNRNPCIVCGYPFSDAHHLYPKIEGGKETIYLCPNHHRYANMIQIIMRNCGLLGEKRAREFALKHFDAQFNEKVLEHLFTEYYYNIPDEFDYLDEAIKTKSPGKVSKRIQKIVDEMVKRKHGNR